MFWGPKLKSSFAYALIALSVFAQGCALKLQVDPTASDGEDEEIAAVHEDESVALVSTTPSSPTNSAATPVALGANNEDIVSVNLYNDLACTNNIGTGTLGQFTGGGISFTRTANATTTLYARALLKSGKLTACTSIGSYVHDDQAPAAPSFSSTDPATPTAATTSVKVIGTAPVDAETITLYNGAGCTVAMESGTKAEWEGAGITVNVGANATTAIYMKSFDSVSNSSGCTHALNFTHDNTGPTSPTFVSTSPSSPSNSDTSPEVILTTSVDTSTVKLFSDSSCVTEIGSGSKATAEGAGITASVNSNGSTAIYAKAYDSLSNASTACALMTTYVHDSNAPNGPSFSSTDPASPSNSSTTPSVIGTADADVVTVKLYSDAGCSTEIGSGTRASFVGAGITATVGSNALTTIRAKTIDAAGNTSACTDMTAYRHDNIDPGAIATVTVASAWSNSTASSPSLSWTASSDAGSGLDHYEYSIGTSSGGTQVKDWTSTVLVTSVTASGLTLSSGTTYYVNVRAYDAAGNDSSVTTSSWTVDTVLPTGLGNPSTTGYATLTQAPQISWTAATDALSGLDEYEYSIGTTSGGNNVRDWTSTGTTNSVTATGLVLTQGATYYTNVRAVDNAGNKTAAKTVAWVVDTIAPSVVITSHADGEAVFEAFKVEITCEPDLELTITNPTGNLTDDLSSGGMCDSDGNFSIILTPYDGIYDSEEIQVGFSQTDSNNNTGTAILSVVFSGAMP